MLRMLVYSGEASLARVELGNTVQSIASHGMGVICPTRQYEPAGHAWHSAVDPALLFLRNVPAGQLFGSRV